MIWFAERPHAQPPRPGDLATRDEQTRMRQALRRVASRAPHLRGEALLGALEETGWIDREAAARLLPGFRSFDAERYFAENLRRLALRGSRASDEFRTVVRSAIEDVAGHAELATIGQDEAIRFRAGDREGIVLAFPEVRFSLGGGARESVAAAVGEMPDALVILARNFQETTADQLSGMLAGSEVPGTLLTVNLLLGLRAVALRYQPGPARVVQTLGAGRPLRSADVASLGDPL